YHYACVGFTRGLHHLAILDQFGHVRVQVRKLSHNQVIPEVHTHRITSWAPRGPVRSITSRNALPLPQEACQTEGSWRSGAYERSPRRPRESCPIPPGKTPEGELARPIRRARVRDRPRRCATLGSFWLLSARFPGPDQFS